jgi:hypothetical protein
VKWRYVTSDREWAMVRFGTRSLGATNWFFVPLKALNPICHDRDCTPQ